MKHEYEYTAVEKAYSPSFWACSGTTPDRVRSITRVKAKHQKSFKQLQVIEHFVTIMRQHYDHNLGTINHELNISTGGFRFHIFVSG